MKEVNLLKSNEKTSLVLMVQNSHRIFCYYNISPMTVKEFEDRHGEKSWKNSKPVIKVYSVENGIAKNIKTIFIDPFADSWYIDVEKDDMDLFVKLGRVIPDNTFVAFAVSNTVTTPRDNGSSDTSLCFVDVSKDFISNVEAELPKFEESKVSCNEPKPYPFIISKKKVNIPN